MRLPLFATILIFGSSCILPTDSLGEDPLGGNQLQVEAWIEKLDSPRYRDRAEATSKLQRMGGSAIDALEQVVIRGSSEASDRAIGILEEHYKNDEDEILKGVAAAALQKIAAQSEHPKSRAAQRLIEADEPTQTKSPRFPQIRNLPAVILPPAVLAPLNRQIRISVNNGKKEITVQERGKSIRIIDNGDDIQVERKDEKGRIVKTKYKNAAELKQKDAEAHKAYQQIAGGGRIQIQMGQHGNLQMQKQIDELRKRLEENRKRHSKLHEQNLKRHQEALERIRKIPVTPPAASPQKQPDETKTNTPWLSRGRDV